MISEKRISAIIRSMTVKERITLCSGKDFWHTKSFEKYGIPEVMMCDGPSGLRKQVNEDDMLGINESLPATCFPAAVTLSQTWNPLLAEKVGEAIAEEAMENHVGMVLAPGVNIKRNPLCGRNFEYYSEDPYLAGKMGAAMIRGIQKNGIACSLKHFAANSQEYKRLQSDSVVDEKALRQIYLKPFEIAVQEGHPKSVMCSYNKINGTYSSDNKWLLTDVLRNEWGFDGMVVTDWGAMNDRTAAFEAGCDLNMPGGVPYGEKEAYQAYQDGRLSEDDINRCAERVLRWILEQNEVLVKHQNDTYDRNEHKKTAIEAAVQGAVLLKNDDSILPLKKEARITLIGHMAEDIRYQGRGSSHINPSELIQIKDVFPDALYCEGCDRNGDITEAALEEVRQKASVSETVLIIAGLPDSYESEGYDRKNMKLPEGIIKMIETAAAVNKRCIVVLLAGSAVEVAFADQVSALIYMGLGGQYTAEALKRLIYGEDNPSGKLSESWPMKYEDVISSSFYGTKNAEYRESIYVGYRYYQKAGIPVRYPFGHGLSYSQFEYDDLKVTPKKVSFTLKNTGAYDGWETVQLYLGTTDKTVFAPVRELRRFEKVFLKKGESREVVFELGEKDFEIYDQGWKRAAHIDEFLIGASAEDIRLFLTLKNNANHIYDQSDWYHTLQSVPSRSDFEALLGHPIVAEDEKTGPYDMNSSLNNLSADSLSARLMTKIAGIVLKNGDKSITDDDPSYRMAMETALGGPLRSDVISSGGLFPEWAARIMVYEANLRTKKPKK